jgi:hypothetical protein
MVMLVMTIGYLLIAEVVVDGFVCLYFFDDDYKSEI